jgi:hypothetical protein
MITVLQKLRNSIYDLIEQNKIENIKLPESAEQYIVIRSTKYFSIKVIVDLL